MRIFCLLALIIFFALLVRFYDFSNRINYGPEQAISLATSGNYIKDKFSLLGITNLQRVTSNGHVIFSGALFTYSLIPLQVVFNFNPLPITGYFALLNIASGLVLFLTALKISNIRVAIFSVILFLFNDYMINHSLFIWIVNYLPILNIAIIYLLFKHYKKEKIQYVFLIGLLAGVSFGLEYLYLFTAILVLAVLLMISRKRISAGLLFLVGAVVGNLPMVAFDIKHDFYHLRVLWQYFLDTLSNPGQGLISYYHFLHFWPLLALLGGLTFNSLYRRFKYAAIGLMGLYISLNLFSPNIAFDKAIGMSEGLTYPKVEKVVKIIADDKPDQFNVATLLDFDTRAHPLRYLLEYRYNLYPMKVDEYPNSQLLYVLAKSDYDFNSSTTWEIASFRPFKVINFAMIDKQLTVFKLVKL